MKKNFFKLPFAILLILAVSCKKEGGNPNNSGYTVSTLPGDFNDPSGVTVDVSGNIYVADRSNRIAKITPSGEINYNFAGAGIRGYEDGPAASAKFAGPYGLTIDIAGNIYVADRYNYRIRKISFDGTVSTLAGTGVSGYQDGSVYYAKFKEPLRVATNNNGVVYVADRSNYCIRKIDNKQVTTVVDRSYLPANVNTVATDSKGRMYFSTDYAVEYLTAEGQLVIISGYLYNNHITDLIYGDDGYVYFVNSADNKICRVDFSGNEITIAGGNGGTEFGYADGNATIAKFHTPMGLAMDVYGNIYVADAGNNKIRKISKK